MTRKLVMGALLVGAVGVGGACQSQEQKKDETKAAGAAAAMTEDEKTVYVIGLRIGGQTTILHLSAAEIEALKRGVADAATGKKPEVDKGTIRFPLSAPVPVKLIERIAKFRAKEAAERAGAKRGGPKKR